MPVPSGAPTAEPPAVTPRKPPLLDAPKRVEQIIRESGGAAALEQLRDAFAPNPSVLHALAIAYAQDGRRADALAVAREAIPLCVRSGSPVLAAEIAVVLRDAMDAAGITADQAMMFAESLRGAKKRDHAAALYGTLLMVRPVNNRVVKGALQTAQDIVAGGDAKASLALYEQLMECSVGTPLHEFVRDSRAEALRKAGVSR